MDFGVTERLLSTLLSENIVVLTDKHYYISGPVFHHKNVTSLQEHEMGTSLKECGTRYLIMQLIFHFVK